MNKYAIVVIICLSFLAGCTNFEKTIEKIATSPRSSESNQPRDKDQIKKSVVKITSQGRQGTGFIVGLMSDTVYILTISHVVTGDSEPKVEFFGQARKFKAETLAIEGQQANGFALLAVTGSIPSDAIPLYVDNKFDLKPGDSVFTFGFPISGGDWAYDDLSYSSPVEREILFSGSDMKEGNSGGPLIKRDKVVGVVTSAGDFAHANSAESIREFLRGAKGGSIVLEQMGKWGVNWRETYDKHLKETSMLAASDKRNQQMAKQRHIDPLPGVTVTSKECKSITTGIGYADGRKSESISTYFCRQSDGTWKEEQIKSSTTDISSDNCQQTKGTARLKCLGFGTFIQFNEGSVQVVPSSGLNEIRNILLDLEENASILITGYTDNYEIENYNVDLSVLRAASVRQWLEDKGVRKGAIQIRGKVIHLPSSATDVHRRQNRHVEFTRIYE
jgi:outer membrane protein OmpA-like peptidoglycan-associated protein